jgi:3-oxoacyl-[acyl-carrier-protein] synthase III
MAIKAVIKGIGHGLPVKVMTNDDLAKIVDTNDEWIVQRTGIKERRMCSGDETTGTLAVDAAREAIAAAGISVDEINMVVVGTVSGDYIWPATASYVQNELGIKNAGAFDVSAACAGFIYSLSVAAAFIESGKMKHVLVVGVDSLSKQINWNDRTTCVLFGDGAGAVILSAEENTDRGLMNTVMFSDGSGASAIHIELGGTKYPPGTQPSENCLYGISMRGQEVFKFAVKAMGDACEKVLAEAGLTADDIDLFVPHQANLRIIDAAAKRFSFPSDKVFVNVEKYGNTSGGSIPLALYEAEKSGRLKKGMLVLTVGFGAGLVWGANLMRW